MQIDHAVETRISRSIRARQMESAFDVPAQEKCRLTWKGELPIEAEPWNIGLIVGPSGCGKSSLLSHVFGAQKPLAWGAPSVIDDFAASLSIEMITKACQSVGFNTIPAWLRPYAVLCVDESTEIMTHHGWRKRGDLHVGDKVLTLDHARNVSMWQGIEAIHQYDVIGEPVLRMHGKAHSSVTSAGHRWPVILGSTGIREWRTSGGRSHQRINTNHLFTTAAPCADLPIAPVHPDAIVELVAWYYTEGHNKTIERRGRPKVSGVTSEHPGVHWDATRKKWFAAVSVDGRNRFLGRFDDEQEAARAAAKIRSHRDALLPATQMMAISQSYVANPAKAERIRGVLAALAGPARQRLGRTRTEPHWCERSVASTGMVVFFLSIALRSMIERLAPDKVPTPEFLLSLTRHQLDVFLEASRLGDGWITNGGTKMFAQVDPRRVDAYEMAMILSGRTPSRWSRARTTPDKYRGHIMHFCSMSERTTVHPIHSDARRSGGRMSRRHESRVTNVVEWTTYTGKMWCPQTVNGTWLARRDGKVFFTGNSNGERFRADIARRMLETPPDETIVIDEFTSVVDRQVAQIASHAVQKFVRRGKRKMVVASCHYDIVDWLQPDWILEPGTMAFSRRLLRQRPALSVSISRVNYAAWQLFAPFHYLTAELHRAAQCFLLSVNDRPAVLCAMLHRTHPTAHDIMGLSRVVTLPDYQGLGLAFVAMDKLASAYKAIGKRFHTYPAHPALISGFDKSPQYAMVRKPGMRSYVRTPTSTLAKNAKQGGRQCAVFEYAGPAMERDQAERLIGASRMQASSAPLP